jgi:hypothetical protein
LSNCDEFTARILQFENRTKLDLSLSPLWSLGSIEKPNASLVRHHLCLFFVFSHNISKLGVLVDLPPFATECGSRSLPPRRKWALRSTTAVSFTLHSRHQRQLPHPLPHCMRLPVPCAARLSLAAVYRWTAFWTTLLRSAQSGVPKAQKCTVLCTRDTQGTRRSVAVAIGQLGLKQFKL